MGLISKAAKRRKYLPPTPQKKISQEAEKKRRYKNLESMNTLFQRNIQVEGPDKSERAGQLILIRTEYVWWVLLGYY